MILTSVTVITSRNKTWDAVKVERLLNGEFSFLLLKTSYSMFSEGKVFDQLKWPKAPLALIKWLHLTTSFAPGVGNLTK